MILTMTMNNADTITMLLVQQINIIFT